LNNISAGVLISALLILIVFSALFSASETAMMAVNRYRVKHLANSGHGGAKLVSSLLAAPDRLLGTILIGNNVANLAASSIATVLGLRYFGDIGVAYATGLLVFVILVFAEVAPKTLAAMYPERIAFPAAYALSFLQVILRPFVWSVSQLGTGLLKLFGANIEQASDSLSADELRAAVLESGKHISKTNQDMLLKIFELDKVTVDDVMVPRSEIEAIDLEDEWEELVEQLATAHHTRLPVFQGELDNIIGVIHLRRVLHISQSGKFNRDALRRMTREPYFIPENTSLAQALINLQEVRHRFGLVVDEYGDLKGLITVEEILEEIVGDFTVMIPGLDEDIIEQDDGSWFVNGSTNIRELNRMLDWNLDTKGPKTLNGLILEYLEDIPYPNTSMRLGSYVIDVVQTRGTAVAVARIRCMDSTNSA
jgi:Mg2+/Co2+ transporter CorB